MPITLCIHEVYISFHISHNEFQNSLFWRIQLLPEGFNCLWKRLWGVKFLLLHLLHLLHFLLRLLLPLAILNIFLESLYQISTYCKSNMFTANLALPQHSDCKNLVIRSTGVLCFFLWFPKSMKLNRWILIYP